MLQPSDFDSVFNKNSGQRLYKWIAAGEPTEGADYNNYKKQLDGYLTFVKGRPADVQKTLGELIDKNFEAHKESGNWVYDGELYTTTYKICKKLYEVSKLKAAAEGNEEHTTLTNAQTALTNANEALSDAQAEIQTIKDNYLAYYVWDLSTNPPTKPEPAPAE